MCLTCASEGCRPGRRPWSALGRWTVGVQLEQLHLVAERVGDVEPAPAGIALVEPRLEAGGGAARRERPEPAHPQRRVRADAGAEPLFRVQVNLRVTGAEPDPAEWRRRRDLRQPEYVAVEGTCLGLAAGRHAELHVVERQELGHAPTCRASVVVQPFPRITGTASRTPASSGCAPPRFPSVITRVMNRCPSETRSTSIA